jgi:hypothetical protein
MNAEYSKLEKVYNEKFGVEPPPSYMLSGFLPTCYKSLEQAIKDGIPIEINPDDYDSSILW